MNKIEVKHSSIVIHDYTWDDCKQLQNCFKIWNSITHTDYYYGIEYLEDEKKLLLPRGLDIPYLENLFGVIAWVNTKCDPYDRYDDIMLKYMPRDDIQKEALDFMNGISDKYKFTLSRSQQGLYLSTGKGKSYCSIASTAFQGYRSAVLTSSLGWLEQWKGYILEYTNTKPSEILIISSKGCPINMLLRKDISQYKFLLISIDSIRSYGDAYGWNKVTELFQFMRIGIKYVDECHKNFETMAKIDYYTNTRKTYYVSATPARSSEAENNIYQLYLKNVSSITLFDEDKDPHTHYLGIRYESGPTPQEKSGCKGRYELDRNKYINYVIKKPNYYKLLTIIINLALKRDDKCLIYIGKNDAILQTREWIISQFPELFANVGIYTSIIDDNVKHAQLDNKIILSTTKSCAEALDIKGLGMTVVLAEPFKSSVIAIQTLGRTRAENTFYIEVVDDSFKPITKYYYTKKPIFSQYAMDCKELSFRKNNSLDIAYDKIIAERYRLAYPIIDNKEMIMKRIIFERIV